MGWRQTDLQRSIYPDAIYFLSYPHLPPKHNTRTFGHETEKSPLSEYELSEASLSEPKIVRRADNYLHYFAAELAIKEYGFPIYAVTFTIKSESTLETILEKIKTKQPKHPYLSRLWFSTEARYHENMGGRIFTDPNEDSHSLLEV
jgi:hypothetical protein